MMKSWETIILHYVIFDLGMEWEKEKEQLKMRLAEEGIFCADMLAGKNARTGLHPPGTAADRGESHSPLHPAWLPEADWKEHMVVLTDQPETGSMLANLGVVYFG
ncbi:MAG: hypothetical protein LUI07_07510 [Lachnospiraceae bacterium]|nr:hypothetical protein [Lachnospiraceae bacterium]